MRGAGWRELVRSPEGDRHIVQVYRDREFLVEAVAVWLGESLRRGGGAIMTGSGANGRDVIARMRALGVDPDRARQEERLVVLDGEELLSAFMVDGAPRPQLFRPLLTDALARARLHSSPAGEVRAWGELVDILVKRGEDRAAAQLEILWNELIDKEGLRLLCSYELDHLTPVAHEGALQAFCAGHSQLISEPDESAFSRALDAALEEEFGETDAAHLRATLAGQRSIPTGMPAPQAVLVALQKADPARGSRVLAGIRGRLAGAPRPIG